MRLLLDTHAFLWFVAGEPSLSAAARLAIVDPANQAFVSIASAWEVAIKVSVRKLTVSNRRHQLPRVLCGEHTPVPAILHARQTPDAATMRVSKCLTSLFLASIKPRARQVRGGTAPSLMA